MGEKGVGLYFFQGLLVVGCAGKQVQLCVYGMGRWEGREGMIGREWMKIEKMQREVEQNESARILEVLSDIGLLVVTDGQLSQHILETSNNPSLEADIIKLLSGISFVKECHSG